MHHHRLVISYKGTQYFGWQAQGPGDPKPTVQASVQEVLKQICKYQHCTISAASRTDAGVHAQGQVAKITIPVDIPSDKLKLGMNSLLPDDIRIVQCESSTTAFNPHKDSTSKEYHYYFCPEPIHNPVINDFVAHTPSDDKALTAEGLDIALMQQGCMLFVGERDFYNFAKLDTDIGSTYRTVTSCEILAMEPSAFGGNIYYLKIVGQGFLRHMIRYIAGALFALGRHQLTLNEISAALANDKQGKLTPRARSRGLHLIRINY